ncbi:class I SAM-dependent DNA methyltransferase [Eubacterium sp.]|uniref:HsdM family class I SAM-dependent methyltransferase n=1 Tax=Eubacterium sp. TaxID=142586 RepID=UPI00258E47CA|nr:class I SAM-dependent DNA methyltransferase [Eubacterium sp.]MCR5367657.1 type I restriction-modification system subunit M [Eubacterium sp.]
MDIKQKTYDLIDSLKAVCHSYGLTGDGNEYKIITQIFLYKFLNDKFGYEVKKISEKLRNAEKWEEAYAAMTEDERLDILDKLSPDVLQLQPEHLVSFLWNNQTKGDFDVIFDSTMIDIAEKNAAIFSTHTTQDTRVLLFEKLTNYITDDAQKANFARALVDKLVSFSFAEAFDQKYDFFAAIFEYLIKDYNAASGDNAYAEYYTPHAIAVIMARLLVGDEADLHNVECYDPSAGTGTLLMALAHQVGEDRCTIFSQDISQKSSKMLKLNLILNGLVASLDNAVQGNTMTEPYHKADDGQQLRQFDYVVSNPPFRMDFSEDKSKMDAQTARFWAGVPNIKPTQPEKTAIYPCFIQHVVNSIKTGGRGAIVVPTGFLTVKSGVEYEVRKQLIIDHAISGVISMPSNVFANTGTNVSVLFFDKSTENKGIILIDATGLGEEYKEGKNKKRRLTNDEIDKIISTFDNRENNEGFSVFATWDKFEGAGYSLSAGKYFEVKVEKLDISSEEYNQLIKKHEDYLSSKFEYSKKLDEEIIDILGRLKYVQA